MRRLARRRRTRVRATRTATRSGSGSAQRYLALFADAPDGALRGESTPFYLYNRDARRRIAADLPRRQADRGAPRPGRPGLLELDAPVGGRARAVRRRRRGVRREQQRVDDGWAPFWHYQGLGMYGRQLADLFEHFPREQVLVLRYRELVDEPARDPRPGVPLPRRRRGRVDEVPADNSRPFVQPGSATKALGPVIRAGAGRRPVLAAAGVAAGQQAADRPAPAQAATRAGRS